MTEYKGLFNMRVFFIILGLLCLPMSIAAVDNEYMVYISTTTSTDLVEQRPEFQQLLGLVEVRLEALSIMVAETEDIPEQSQFISLAVLENEVRIFAKGTKGFHLSISDILYTNAILPTCCSSNPYAVMERLELSENSVPDIADLIVALSLYQTGQYTASLTAFDNLPPTLLDHAESPQSIINFVNLYKSNNLIMLGEYETAIKIMRKLAVDSPSIIYVVNLAWLYIQTGDVQNAVDLLEQSPDFPSSVVHNALDQYPRRAQLYALAFEYDAALNDINTAITLVDDNPKFESELPYLYTLRGEMVLLLYEWRRAIEDFDTALEYNPEYAPAYFQRGVAHYTDLNPAAALGDFEQYLQRAPDGDDAALAQQYIDIIQAELDALGGD